LDEDTHMCPADVDIRCPTCLLGETVRVSLVVRAKPSAIVVPEDAVFLRNGQAMVYVVDNKQVKLKRVKLGIKQDDKVEITKGLHAGELLIIRGQERLYPEITVDVLVKKSL
jgi:membrane fusion protein (multidrug efflux system)